MKRYRTELLLSEQQITKVNKTIGVCRYVYNLYIHTAQKHYQEQNRHLTGYDFSKWLNNVYTKENDMWIKEVSSKAVKQSILNGDKAYKNFFKGISRYPRFKKKKNQDVGVYLPKNSKTDILVERHRIKLPTFGWLRLKEYGYLPSENITSATITCKNGRYYVSLLCNTNHSTRGSFLQSEGVGIDLGISNFASCSNEMVFKNINKTNKIQKIEKRLKRHQRRINRSYENNKKWENIKYSRKNMKKYQTKVRKLYEKLSNIRREYIRYVVSVLVKTKPSYITIEDLRIKNMLKNKNLSKAISTQNFYNFRVWVLNKCKENNIELRLVSQWYPSSKICSMCGFKKVSLSLSERLYSCSNCNITIDRDFNASLNLKYAKEYTVLT